MICPRDRCRMTISLSELFSLSRRLCGEQSYTKPGTETYTLRIIVHDIYECMFFYGNVSYSSGYVTRITHNNIYIYRVYTAVKTVRRQKT